MSRPNRKVHGLSDILTFGKYKTYAVRTVIEDDPKWIYWAIENIEGFELSNEAYNMLPPEDDCPDYYD